VPAFAIPPLDNDDAPTEPRSDPNAAGFLDEASDSESVVDRGGPAGDVPAKERVGSGSATGRLIGPAGTRRWEKPRRVDGRKRRRGMSPTELQLVYELQRAGHRSA